MCTKNKQVRVITVICHNTQITPWFIRRIRCRDGIKNKKNFKKSSQLKTSLIRMRGEGVEVLVQRCGCRSAGVGVGCTGVGEEVLV